MQVHASSFCDAGIQEKKIEEERAETTTTTTTPQNEEKESAAENNVKLETHCLANSRIRIYEGTLLFTSPRSENNSVFHHPSGLKHSREA